MKVLAYLNLHHAPRLGPLTTRRSTAVVSFLGRYAIMDFMLSNFSNSGFDRIATLVDNHPDSVLKHFGSRNTFNINTKLGLEIIAYNEGGSKAGPRYNTDIANIVFNDWILEQADPNYVVVAPSYFILPIDFRPILKQHIAKKSKVTAVYQRVNNARNEYIGRAIFDLNKDGHVINISRNKGEKDARNIGLEIYIFNRETFDFLIRDAQNISSFYSLSDIVAYHALKDIRVDTYEYVGYMRCIDSYQHYYDYSFELLNYRIRRQLFLHNWPIYTVTHDTPPAKYEATADVKNAFIANGSLISGMIKNSIISRNVKIEEGAVVENSIIFTDSIVRRNKVISHAIIDKKAEVAVAAELAGTPEDILYVRKGDRV
ncbi:MAG TPA: glucose-1-phosphate adenylyltransferase subunit GlgD [Bacilli bacterium]|jgi:glucose-1-phosphate adenylyltransferase|nr:glucose-1-phosphate adenylyltransferase subunit GlgD [Bacilli bacterium]HOQ70470.1 glucose-1-phosphate adenylyltransferase subunit GlgD [Bacilli bacterium]HPK29127.1 glucose-1-phosphate adenylyltransferase subunit GlgD [Bacilli bacterium]